MRIPIYQVDAFTSGVFSGNPAAIQKLGHIDIESMSEKRRVFRSLSDHLDAKSSVLAAIRKSRAKSITNTASSSVTSAPPY